jgi:hypothetical protein
MDFPKGENARFINLKCCLPKGMPTMVIHNSNPKKRWVSAIQKPPNMSQMIFIMVDRQPVLEEVSVILIPKGARPTKANLKHCKPKGMPTIVRHSIIPPKMYSKKMNKPPKIIQMILPNKFMRCFSNIDKQKCV